MIYCAFPICVLIVPDSFTRVLAVTSRHLVAKQGEARREMAVNFADKVSLSYFAGFFNMP
jgi:hypothetical protein